MTTSVFSLSNRSEEFRRVDYLLKLSLRTSSIHDVGIWHFSNPHQAARFEERTQDLEVLHAWVDADELETSLDTLANRGFVFGANGQTFTTGTLPYDDRDDQTPRRLILCQIGVGRSFVLDELTRNEEGAETGQRLPEGYDSIFLARPQEESSDAVYRHEYILFDTAQALPMYLVQYVPGPAQTDDRSKRLLEWPGSTAMTNVLQGSPPPPVIEAIYDRFDFFDPVWYVPVSVRDKMVGSHSAGDAAMHKLIGIGDAYDAALNESLKPDPILIQRQQEIKAQLRAIDAKLRDVNRNSAEVEERIYKALQDALFQLQDLTQKKLNTLLSEEVELRRQLQHMDWIESFLDRQRDEADQVGFLNAWKCHVQLRGDLCRNPIKTAEVLQSVQADLEFEGGVRVLATSQYQPPPPSQQQSRGGTMKGASAAQQQPSGKRKQQRGGQGMLMDSTPNRKGSGSMMITGTPSPLSNPPAGSMSQQQLTDKVENYSMIQPPGGAVNGNDNSLMLQPDLDVTRAFVEALKHQKESMVKDTDTMLPHEKSQLKLVEVPPTPPAQRKSRKPVAHRGPEAFVQYSLSGEAQRKSKSFGGQVPDPRACFDGSRLISAATPPPPKEDEKTQQDPVYSMSDAQILFLTLPVHARSRTELLYATWREDLPSIQGLLQSLPKQQVVVQDGEQTKTVLITEFCPTLLVIKANGKVFGGFASDSWREDGEAFGNAKCFLFSMDNDVKIPFTGKETLPISREMADLYRQRDLPVPKFGVLSSNTHKLQFGVGDLVIANNFREGASQLEHSFGIGLNEENGEAEAFLAGGPRFMCDAVELWAIRS